MNRRRFLTTCTALLPWALGTPFTLATPTAANPARRPRTLILIELKGGNDGLNTVIPYGDPHYYRLRPTLAIAKDQVLPLTDRLGLHPALAPLLPLWQQHHMAIFQGVGYDRPNLSHFRSIEIWNTASRSNEVLEEGWLTRLFQHQRPVADAVADGIVIGADPGPLSGHSWTITLHNPRQFFRQAQRMPLLQADSNNPALAHILAVYRETRRSALALAKQLKHRKPTTTGFPETAFGRQLALAAELILSNIPVAVIKTAHGSFDTHRNQPGQHRRLLSELAEGIAALSQNLRRHQRWHHVLIMTYSEFGRRPKENGSRGTDHGTAAPHFFFGDGIDAGLHGPHPSLTDLDNGNLRYHTDFRSLYRHASRICWDLTPV